MVRERMGKLLLEAGCISEEQLHVALQVQQDTKARLGTILVEQGAISEHTLLTFLGQQYGLPVLHDPPDSPDPGLTQFVSFEWAQQQGIVPIKKIGNRLTVAMVNPADESQKGVFRNRALLTGTLLARVTETKIDASPSVLGKATTLFQSVYIILVLTFSSRQLDPELLTPLLYTVCILTVASGLHYIVRGVSNMNSPNGDA